MMKMIMNFQMSGLMVMSLINLFINIIPSQNKMIHPIIMGLILLSLMMLSSINIELYNSMNWISYLMFLIIIGGLMIIFLYFTSFISNMKMSIKWNYIIMMPMKMMLMMIFISLMFMKFKYYLPWYNNSMELKNFINQINFKLITMYMYMYNKNYTMIFCMIYLLMVLIFIVKICINNKLSLRKIN